MARSAAWPRRAGRLLHRNPRFERQFAAHRRFTHIARQRRPTGQAISDEHLRGVHLPVETRREYLLGDAAWGFCSSPISDNAGVDGPELRSTTICAATPGWTTLRPRRRGRHALPRDACAGPRTEPTSC
jgi:hypothetical protein